MSPSGTGTPDVEDAAPGTQEDVGAIARDVEPLPAVTVPQPSAEFTKHSPEGAVAAALFFRAARDYAFDSGDPQLLRYMSSADCAICEEVVSWVEELKASGERIRHGAAELVGDPQVTDDPDFDGGVIVHLTDVPGVTQLIDAQGRVTEELDGGKRREQKIWLAPDDAGWFVRGYEELVSYM